MKWFFLLSLVQCACMSATTVHGHRILFVSLFSTKSHKYVLGPVAEELAKRGHEVVFLSSVKDKKPLLNVTDVYFAEAEKIMTDENFNFFLGDVLGSKYLELLMDAFYNLTNAMYSHPYVQELIKTPHHPKTNDPKFDLVVLDTVFNQFALPIAHHLGVPNIYMSPGILVPTITTFLDIPFPLSYIPIGTVPFTSNMSFKERAINLYLYTFMIRKLYFELYPNTDKIISRYLPNSPSLENMERNVSFVITNDYPSLLHSQPTMPYYIKIGGIHIKPVKNLPKDLQDYLDSSGEHGVVYFSLGSYTKGTSMPKEMRDKLVKAFSQIPQKVLWKNEDPIDGVSKNVKVISWAPQQDLLAHPNVRLFITHGGLLSLEEAVYHGCPILGFPLSADQAGNMATAKELGFGDYIEWRTFTADELIGKISAMTGDARYQESARRYSSYIKDRPDNPVETAVYWLEYVIRHKGAAHLKSAAGNLNFFQYFLLDIIGLLAAVILIVVIIMVWVFKKLLQAICGSKRSKQSTKQKRH